MLQTFRTKDVTKYTGLSQDRINRYVHSGLVKPSINSTFGTGNQWLFGFDNLLQFRVIKKLLDIGLTPGKIKKASDFLNTQLNQTLEGSFLVSDGKTLYVKCSQDELLDLLKEGQYVITIALDEVYQDLCKQLSKGQNKEKNVNEKLKKQQTPKINLGNTA